MLFIPSNELDRLRTALSKEGRTMILLPEYFQEALPREADGFQPILKRFGYVLLGNEPMVDHSSGYEGSSPDNSIHVARTLGLNPHSCLCSFSAW